ncbi:hypothetical protein SCALM49S_05143 [Streptomyces californicus]
MGAEQGDIREGARSGSAAEELAGWFKRSCMWVTIPCRTTDTGLLSPRRTLR